MSTAEALQRIDFDCPFLVLGDGTLSDGNLPGIYAPVVYHSETDDIEIQDGLQDWKALTGYTGQYSYSGAVMHPSETLSGGLAADILATPGVYVVTSVEVMPEDDDDYPEPAGWTVLRMQHVNYPHWPGRLYDCKACEVQCHCDADEGTTACVYAGPHLFGKVADQ